MGKDEKRTVTPTLRFPEFRDGEAWTTEPMERLYSFMRNNAMSRDKLNYQRGSVKNIHYGDIHTKFQTLFDITQESVPYINDTEPLPPFGSEDYCVEGDLIFADASEDTNDVGKSIEIVRLNADRLLSGQHTILARRNDERLILGFGGHLFKSGRIRSQIMKEAQGTKVYAISATRLGNIEVAFPADEKEQHKIADCLTSLDEVIAAQGRRVEALKAHKKALMQQLFPREGETLPRLRFPEFRDAGERKEKRIAEITSAIFDGTHQTPRYTDDGIPFYSVENLISGNANKFISKADYDLATKKNKPEKGDILLTRIGKIGFSQVVTWNHAFSVYVTLAVIKRSNQFDSHYLHCLMQSDFYQSELRSKSLSNAVPPKINMDSLRETRVLLPSLAEQHKIADCLSALDARIAAEADKLAALKTHKKGLMQQLFPLPEGGGA